MLVANSPIQASKGDETMRSGQFFNGIRRFLAKLKVKWADYWNGILESIAEEEMRIRHIEYDERIVSDGRRA